MKNMKKVIKLTENDLNRIVRRTIEEQSGQSTGQTPAQTPAQPTKQGTITIQLSVPQLPNINKQDLETYFKSPEFQKLLLNKFKERTNENDLNRIVRRVIKEQDGDIDSRRTIIDKDISSRLLNLLQKSVSHVGREETSNFLEKVASKLMDYDNTGIQSDYNVNFDWIQDVVREMGDSDEILMNKNREKHNFDSEQRGWTKNRY